jgi:hypothetical protein
MIDYAALKPFAPSLPAFGVLFLEIVTGQHIKLDDIDSMRDIYRKNGLFGDEVAAVVQLCVYDTEFKAGETIRESERLRQRFLSEVVLPLQNDLYEAFKLDFEKLFSSGSERRDPSTTRKRTISSMQARPSPRTPSPDAASGAIESIETPFRRQINNDQWRLHGVESRRAPLHVSK